MKAYQLIQQHYGTNKTERSQVPLMNHIDEGLNILRQIKATSIVQEAYCLHPLFQSNESFNCNKTKNYTGVSTEALILTIEYRRVANSYLSFANKTDFVGFPCPEIKQMLLADKLQNYKDFMQYHFGTHTRSEELYSYFHNWFYLLEANLEEWRDYLEPI